MELLHASQSHQRLLIAYTCLILALLICSCGGDKRKVADAEQEANKKLSQELVEYFAKPDQEKVALLSIKYGIGFDIVENLLDAYLSRTDLEYKSSKSSTKSVKSSEGDDTSDPVKSLMRQKSEYAKILTQLANELQISPVVAASIVIDYKHWKAPVEASNNQ
jgi:hypothetical protein